MNKKPFLKCKLKKDNKVASIHIQGNQLDLLTMLVAVSKHVIDEIAIQRNLDVETVIELVSSSVKEGYETVKQIE